MKREQEERIPEHYYSLENLSKLSPHMSRHAACMICADFSREAFGEGPWAGIQDDPIVNTMLAADGFKICAYYSEFINIINAC